MSKISKIKIRIFEISLIMLIYGAGDTFNENKTSELHNSEILK